MLTKFEKILVTGGGGFIGSHVTEKLMVLDKDVTILDNLSTGREENIPKGVKFVKGDIRDFELLKNVMNDIDLVFHEAANASTPKSVEDPKHDFDVNAFGALNVLSAAIKCGVRKVVYASSAAVYGEPKYVPIDEKHLTDPISPYGVSKLAGERYCIAFHKSYGLRAACLRFFNVYGPRENLETTLDEVILYSNAILHNRLITVLGDGNQTRDFVYVEDVVEAQLLAAERNEAEGEVINVGTGVETSINNLVETIEMVSGRKAVTQYAPPRKGDILRSFGDISKAQRILGYKPKFTLKNGIQKLMKYL